MMPREAPVSRPAARLIGVVFPSVASFSAWPSSLIVLENFCELAATTQSKDKLSQPIEQLKQTEMIQSAARSEGKWSTRSFFIQFERKRKSSSLSAQKLTFASCKIKRNQIVFTILRMIKEKQNSISVSLCTQRTESAFPFEWNRIALTILLPIWQPVESFRFQNKRKIMVNCCFLISE